MRPSIARSLLFAALALGSSSLAGAQPRAETLRAWDVYRRQTEARIQSEMSSREGFLAVDFMAPSERSRCLEEVRKGDVCVVERKTLSEDGKPIDVPYGIVHHWYGAVFVPGVTLDRVLAWLKSYDDREKYYRDVEASRLISRDGEAYHIFLRLKRTKIITVYYDTEHEVVYESHGPGRASAKSVATRIRELDKAGESGEREKSVEEDRGFLWRLDSYWRFEERDGGTFVECESLSLSRSIPAAAEWLVLKFVESVPRESLEGTLAPIREHFLSERTAGRF
jgi:hypothetical protein